MRSRSRWFTRLPITSGSTSTGCTSSAGADRFLVAPPTLIRNTSQQEVEHAQRAFLEGQPREGVGRARLAPSELQAAQGGAERRVPGPGRLDGGVSGSGAVRGARLGWHRQVPQAEA